MAALDDKLSLNPQQLVHRAGFRKVMAEAAKRTKVRGGHKAHFKKLCTAADEIMKDFDPKKEPELRRVRESLKRKSEVIAQLDEILQDILR